MSYANFSLSDDKFALDTSSEDSSKCCTAFKQNQCPMFKTPRKCIYNPGNLVVVLQIYSLVTVQHQILTIG